MPLSDRTRVRHRVGSGDGVFRCFDPRCAVLCTRCLIPVEGGGASIRARPILRGASAMTQHPDLFAALAAPFDPSEIKNRSQSGRQLHYITARTAMNRLDAVLGPENWWDR